MPEYYAMIYGKGITRLRYPVAPIEVVPPIGHSFIKWKLCEYFSTNKGGSEFDVGHWCYTYKCLRSNVYMIAIECGMISCYIHTLINRFHLLNHEAYCIGFYPAYASHLHTTDITQQPHIIILMALRLSKAPVICLCQATYTITANILHRAATIAATVIIGS